MDENFGFKKLIVFQKAFDASMTIYSVSKNFPSEEKYSLTDQIRRSSRSVSANIAEGYRKKIYPKSFIAKLVDADGECSETLVWIEYARQCTYLSSIEYESLKFKYEEVGKLLGYMIKNISKYL